MSTRTLRSRIPKKLLIFIAIILLVGLAMALIDFSPNLDYLRARMLSGPQEGNYHAVVTGLSERAHPRGGRIENVATDGSRDNLERLAAGCNAHFALVQDGLPAPAGEHEIELIGRLQKSESMFFVGKDAHQFTRFAQLAGMTIGVGPAGSGTDHLARAILEADDFKSLGLRLQNHEIGAQLDLLQRGVLSLGVFVLDEDAQLIRTAVRERGLQLASFAHLDVIARQHPFLSHGRIGAGQFDAVRLLPPTDTRVLRVGTLVLGNGCADHAEMVALLSLLDDTFPGFIDFNRNRPGHRDFELSSSARRFFDNGGPEFTDRHVPWLVSLLPPTNWVYIIMSLSILFNLMGLGHRFRLWRLDANTDKAVQTVRVVLGERLTPAEIEQLSPSAAHITEDGLENLERAMADLDRLRAKCRRQAASMLVPMGNEWKYRYSEQQMEEFLTALRKFRCKAENMAASNAARPGSPSVTDPDAHEEAPA